MSENFARPVEDFQDPLGDGGFNDPWTTLGGGSSDLFGEVDEVDASDADGVRSGIKSPEANSGFMWRLDEPTEIVDAERRLVIRTRKFAGPDGGTLRIQLYDDDPLTVGNQVWSGDVGILGDFLEEYPSSFTTYEFDLSAVVLADYSSLYVLFQLDDHESGGGQQFDISWFHFRTAGTEGGGGDTIEIDVQPSDIPVNQEIEQVIPEVTVSSSLTGTTTVSLASNPEGAVLRGTLSQTMDGTAVFDDLRVDRPGNYRLTFSINPEVTSDEFAVGAPFMLAGDLIDDAIQECYPFVREQSISIGSLMRTLSRLDVEVVMEYAKNAPERLSVEVEEPIVAASALTGYELQDALTYSEFKYFNEASNEWDLVIVSGGKIPIKHPAATIRGGTLFPVDPNDRNWSESTDQRLFWTESDHTFRYRYIPLPARITTKSQTLVSPVEAMSYLLNTLRLQVLLMSLDGVPPERVAEAQASATLARAQWLGIVHPRNAASGSFGVGLK